MAVPIDVATGPGGPEPDAPLSVAGKAIEGRSLGQIAWMRLRRDKVAMGGGIVVVFLILVAIIGPHVVQNPDTCQLQPDRPDVPAPIGSFGGISLAHPLGVEPESGRDLLARIVVGAQYSLLIAFLATVLAVSIGTFFGVVAGYVGGWVDSIIARAMDVFLAFPLLVFALALAGVIPSSAFGLSGNSLRIGVLIFVIGFFNWPYMGRIIRGQTLSLREREFVDAARSLGARTPYILFTRTAAEPGGADPGLRDPADPDQHLVRGGPVLPRRRPLRADTHLGADALQRGAERFLLHRPGVHARPRADDFHHGTGIQPIR